MRETEQHGTMRYNELGGVGEAYRALRARWDRFLEFLGEASDVAVRCGLDDAVGVFLLHRHFEVTADTFMLERPEALETGERALTTAVRAKATNFSWVPSRLAVESGGRGTSPDAIALEYSTDTGALRAYQRLNAHRGFVADIALLVRRFGFGDLLGLATVTRDWLRPTAELSLIERDDVVRLASVVTLERIPAADEHSLVPTVFSLRTNRMCYCESEYRCDSWCLGADPHERPHERNYSSHRHVACPSPLRCYAWCLGSDPHQRPHDLR